MDFHQILKLQVGWLLAGITYNIWSVARMQLGLSPLSTTEPVSAMVLFMGLGAILWSGYAGHYKTYLVSNTLFLSLIAYGGIYIHLDRYWASGGFEGYASSVAWGLALAINLYGVGVSVWASKTALCTRKEITNESQ